MQIAQLTRRAHSLFDRIVKPAKWKLARFGVCLSFKTERHWFLLRTSRADFPCVTVQTAKTLKHLLRSGMNKPFDLGAKQIAFSVHE